VHTGRHTEISFLPFWLPISETVHKGLVKGRTVQLVCNIYDVIKKVRSHSLVSIALLMIPLYDLCRFIISLDREISYVFTFFLDTALYAYATEIACLQSFSEYILLPVSCTLLFAAACVSSTLCRVSAALGVAWQGVRRVGIRPSLVRSVPTAASMRFILFSSGNICGRQLSMASAPTLYSAT